MILGKLATALALIGTLATSSQGVQSCDTSTGAPHQRVQQDSGEVAYSATCDNKGGVISYRPHTKTAKQAAISGCRKADQYADSIQRQLNKRQG